MDSQALIEIEARLRRGDARVDDVAALARAASEATSAGVLLLAGAIAAALGDGATDSNVPSPTLARVLPPAQMRLADCIDVEDGSLRADVPVGTINDVRCASGAPMLSEAPFFVLPPGAALVATGAPGDGQSDALVAAARSLRPRFQLGMLTWLRDASDDDGLMLVEHVLDRMEASAAGGAEHALWRLAHGFSAALRAGGVKPGPAVTRLLGQVDRHLKRLADADPAREPMPEPLLRNLLFYVESAGGADARLTALVQEFELGQMFAMPDPAAMAERARALGPELANALAGVSIGLGSGGSDRSLIGEQVGALHRVADSLALLGQPDLHAQCRSVAAQLDAGGVSASALVRRLESLAAALASAGEDLDEMPAAPGVDLDGMRAILDRIDGTGDRSGQARASPGDPPLEQSRLAAAPRGSPGLLPGVDIEALARRTQGLAEPGEPLASEPFAGPSGEAPAPARATPTPEFEPSASADEPLDREDYLGALGVLAGQIAGEQVALEQHITGIHAGLVELERALDALRERLERGPGDREAETIDALDVVRGSRRMLESLADDSVAALVRQSRNSIELQRALMREQLVAMRTIGRRLDTAVASIASRHGKPLALRLGGLDAAVDPSRVEVIAAVMEQAIDIVAEYGIEAGAVREFRRKPAVAEVEARFEQRGAWLEIVLEFDGEPVAAEQLQAAQSLLIELGGDIEVAARPPAPRFTLRLPLEPRLFSLMLVEVAGELAALSMEGIVAVVAVTLDTPGTDGAPVPAAYRHDGEAFPFAALATVLGFTNDEGVSADSPAPVVLVRDGEARAALVCSGVRGRVESVVRAVPPLVAGDDAVVASTAGPDARPVLVFDSKALARRLRRRQQ